METPKDLTVVRQEITDFIQAKPMVVTNRSTAEDAKSAMTVVRKEHRARKAWFTDHILAHAEKTLKEARSARDAQRLVMEELLRPFADWEKVTDANIIKFETEERLRIKKKEAAELAAYNKRLAAAEAKGKDPELVKGPLLPAEAPKTTKTAAGGYSTRINKVLVIFDAEKIPESYYDRVRNDTRIEADLRNNIPIPGAKLEEKLGSAIRG